MNSMKALIQIYQGENTLSRVWRYQREVIRIRISKKNRQYNGKKKKYKRTNNDLQNIINQFFICKFFSLNKNPDVDMPLLSNKLSWLLMLCAWWRSNINPFNNLVCLGQESRPRSYRTRDVLIRCTSTIQSHNVNYFL
jgi:hypothetical protein